MQVQVHLALVGAPHLAPPAVVLLLLETVGRVECLQLPLHGLAQLGVRVVQLLAHL